MSTAQARATRRIKLDRRSNGMLMTPEEFDAVADWDDRFVYELVHGVVIVFPPPGEAERDPNGELDFLFRHYRLTHPQGSILDKTQPERYLPVPNGRRRADRVVWTGLGRVPELGTDIPSVLIEFVSKRRRDRRRDYEEKRREFLALGVREYWIIDRFARTLNVFRAAPGEPSEVVVKAEETYRTPVLPGFELLLARLLKLADDWARPSAPKKTARRKQST